MGAFIMAVFMIAFTTIAQKAKTYSLSLLLSLSEAGHRATPD